MRRLPDPARLLAFGALFALTACAPTFTSAALGRSDFFAPHATMRGRTVQLELAQRAHVAVVQVLTPTPGNQDRPVLFVPLYPRFETDQREFEPGTHRLAAREETFRQDWVCGDTQSPTMDGCRRDYRYLPGVRSLAEYHDGYTHFITLVSDQPIDPYALAEELFYMAFDDPRLAQQFRDVDAEAAAATLEQALLDRPGSANWAAHYVAGR